MPARSLLKALTESGAGPRRRMAEAIKQGKVQVNGETAESFNQPVDIETDRVSIDGKTINLKPDETVCLMLNKPAGVVSTVSDEKGRRTVLDILPERYKKLRLYPAGRLDADSTGLLLLTNDGDLTYRLTHPKFELGKEYLVQIQGRLGAEEVSRLERGIRLEDGMTAPATVKVITTPPFNYSITIHEGRKRQVRRMFERLGHTVLALKRVRIGGLGLGNLKEGEARLLRPAEIASLLSGNQIDKQVNQKRDNPRSGNREKPRPDDTQGHSPAHRGKPLYRAHPRYRPGDDVRRAHRDTQKGR
jgi:23S rRNA pseudouridine2605 synthase